MFLILLGFFLLVFWVGFILWKQISWIVMYKQLYRSPWNIPVFGNAFLLAGDSEDRMIALQEFGRVAIEHGGLTSLWLGPRYIVMVADADVTELVLRTCLDKGNIMDIVQELLGNGSIFATPHIWRPRRKVIASTFSMKNLNQFVEVFSQQSRILVEQLQRVAGKDTISVWKYLTTYTMDSVCETALGVKIEAQRHPEQPVLEAFNQFCQMTAMRLLLPPFAQKGYKYLPIYNQCLKHIHCMWDFVDGIVKNKRKEVIAEEKKKLPTNNDDLKEKPSKKTFLELFIEASGGKSGFTDLELREETLVLLLAGTDTSAVGSAFICLMLARHPDVQDKVYEEIKEVLGDSAGPITAADLLKLKYLDAVVKETLRLYPPAPVIVRKVENDLQLPSGLTMAKGTSLMINIWAIHRNPVYWGEDAEQFKPDRFIGSAQQHSVAFIPFSHGPRSCLGYQYAMMSMKTAIANLVRHYRFHPATAVQDKNAPLRVKFDIMMKPVENFELQVEARS